MTDAVTLSGAAQWGRFTVLLVIALLAIAVIGRAIVRRHRDPRPPRGMRVLVAVQTTGDYAADLAEAEAGLAELRRRLETARPPAS